MGWNSSVILVSGTTPAQVLKAIPDVFAVTDRFVDWGEAGSSGLYPHAAVGAIPGWVAVWTSNGQLVMFDEFLETASRRGRAVACLQSSVSTIHGFAVYEKGRHRRTHVRENYEPAADVGDPLPEESGLTWDDDEDTVFEVVRLLTGVDVTDEATWLGVSFRVVEAP